MRHHIWLLSGITLAIIVFIVWLWPRSTFTVGAMLHKRGITVSQGDKINPHPWLPYVGQKVVVVQERAVATTAKNKKQVPTPTLAKGSTRVSTPAKPGLALIEVRLTITKTATKRQTKQLRTLKASQPATVLIGTSPAHTLKRHGVTYHYAYERDMVATAYDASYAQNGPSGPVARLGGRPLTRGMVAVDPSVIPLGTRLYVEGYGPALAADTGSAIVGNRIDLFFPYSGPVVSRYGIRRIHVYILD